MTTVIRQTPFTLPLPQLSSLFPKTGTPWTCNGVLKARMRHGGAIATPGPPAGRTLIRQGSQTGTPGAGRRGCPDVVRRALPVPESTPSVMPQNDLLTAVDRPTAWWQAAAAAIKTSAAIKTTPTSDIPATAGGFSAASLEGAARCRSQAHAFCSSG